MSRPREIAMIVAVATLLLCRAPAYAQTAPASVTLTTAQWQADLRYLAAQMPLRHKNLYHTMTPAAFQAAVAQLDADIPHLNGDEITLRLIALATLPTDSHTGAFGFPPGRSFPLRLRHYEDGIYVEAAPEQYRAVVGGKLVAIGTTPAGTIYDRLLTVIPHDTANSGLQGLIAPVLMTMGPVLHGLDVMPTADAASYTIEKSGKRTTLDLTPTADTRALFGYAPLDGWVDARATGAAPFWLQHPGETFWASFDPASGIYYIQFNAVADTPTQTVAQFFDATFADVARVKPDKLVLDIRNNGGGNNYLLKPIIVGIIRLREIDRPGHLFVITSRSTYSAAQNLVNRLEQYTDAVFVGAPTGQHVNSYGDPAQIKLPNSGLTVGMASVWWQDNDERDKRTETDPSVAADLTFADYVAGRDPAITAVVAYRPGNVEDAVLAGVASGGAAGGLAAYRAYVRDPPHRYMDAGTLEKRVNAVGYDLVAKHDFETAIAVFTVNAEANAASANARDSLGEAYADAGDKANAITAYRAALAINPNLASSRAALSRLGASP
jgi:hypothetical protein